MSTPSIYDCGHVRAIAAVWDCRDERMNREVGTWGEMKWNKETSMPSIYDCGHVGAIAAV